MFSSHLPQGSVFELIRPVSKGTPLCQKKKIEERKGTGGKVENVRCDDEKAVYCDKTVECSLWYGILMVIKDESFVRCIILSDYVHISCSLIHDAYDTRLTTTVLILRTIYVLWTAFVLYNTATTAGAALRDENVAQNL